MRRPPPAPAAERCQPEERRVDFRLTVLVLIGLAIALQHLPRLGLLREKPEAPTAATFVWLESDDQAGIYRVPATKPFTIPQIFRSLGLTTPATTDPDKSFHFAPRQSHFFFSHRSPAAAPLLPPRAEALLFQPISINQASGEVLATLPGVGSRTAERIIAFRTQHGRIKDSDDLRQIAGIGPQRAARLDALIRYR